MIQGIFSMGLLLTIQNNNVWATIWSINWYGERNWQN